MFKLLKSDMWDAALSDDVRLASATSKDAYDGVVVDGCTAGPFDMPLIEFHAKSERSNGSNALDGAIIEAYCPLTSTNWLEPSRYSAESGSVVWA